MIGATEIERYRAMSVEDKLREFNQLMEAAFELLDALPEDERRRRWSLWTHDDDEASAILARRLAGSSE